MLGRLIRERAKAKVLENKENIRVQMKLLSPDDLGIIFEAIENERDIIPFIPENVLAQLKGKAVYFDALSNVDFLLGLTDEIFPEYSELLRGKNGWLERQLSQLKEFI